MEIKNNAKMKKSHGILIQKLSNYCTPLQTGSLGLKILSPVSSEIAYIW